MAIAAAAFGEQQVQVKNVQKQYERKKPTVLCHWRHLPLSPRLSRRMRKLAVATCNLQLAAKLPLAAFNWLLLGHVQRQLPPCALEQFLSKLWHKLAAPLREIEEREGETVKEKERERERGE